MNDKIAKIYIEDLADSARVCSEVCLTKDKPAKEKEHTCLDQCNQKLVKALAFSYGYIDSRREEAAKKARS